MKEINDKLNVKMSHRYISKLMKTFKSIKNMSSFVKADVIHTLKIFAENMGIKFRGGPARSEITEDNLNQFIDKNLQSIILKLNKHGVETNACCEGSILSDGYIEFSDIENPFVKKIIREFYDKGIVNVGYSKLLNKASVCVRWGMKDKLKTINKLNKLTMGIEEADVQGRYINPKLISSLKNLANIGSKKGVLVQTIRKSHSSIISSGYIDLIQDCDTDIYPLLNEIKRSSELKCKMHKSKEILTLSWNNMPDDLVCEQIEKVIKLIKN